jgi:hypothetical protein
MKKPQLKNSVPGWRDTAGFREFCEAAVELIQHAPGSQSLDIAARRLNDAKAHLSDALRLLSEAPSAAMLRKRQKQPRKKHSPGSAPFAGQTAQ